MKTTNPAIRETHEFGYYVKKWNISILNLSNAIRNTGTTEIRKLKSYLRDKKLI